MKHKAKLAGQARHLLTIIGAALVAGGYADESMIQEIIGGAMTAIGLVMSWTSKAKKVGEGDIG